MKIGKFIGLVFVSAVSITTIFLFEIKDWPVGSSLSGIVLGFSLPGLWHSIQDLLDTTNWKVSQRRLKRGGFITDDTIIRISFAYLYRIKISGKYLLVKNERGTGKYQPVGGVYKLKGNEKTPAALPRRGRPAVRRSAGSCSRKPGSGQSRRNLSCCARIGIEIRFMTFTVCTARSGSGIRCCSPGKPTGSCGQHLERSTG